MRHNQAERHLGVQVFWLQGLIGQLEGEGEGLQVDLLVQDGGGGDQVFELVSKVLELAVEGLDEDYFFEEFVSLDVEV